eukprot:gene2211-2726_t
MTALILNSNLDNNPFSSSSSSSSRLVEQQQQDVNSTTLIPLPTTSAFSSPSSRLLFPNEKSSLPVISFGDTDSLSETTFDHLKKNGFSALAPSTSEFSLLSDAGVDSDYYQGIKHHLAETIVAGRKIKRRNSLSSGGNNSSNSASSNVATAAANKYSVQEIFDPDEDEGCDQALQLYTQSFFPPAEPPERQISQLVRSHFYRVIVMRDEHDEVVACAFLIEMHEFNCYHIDYLCVRPDQRGNGIGGKFFKQLADHLRSEQRYLFITLESETNMVGWYLKQSVLHLNVQSDKLEENGVLRKWWLLVVPLGDVMKIDRNSSVILPTSAPDLLPINENNKSSDEPQLTDNPSYLIHNETNGLRVEFNPASLGTIVKGVKTLLKLAALAFAD